MGEGTRIAMGWGTAITSFVVMLLLAVLAVEIAYPGFELDYNSSALPVYIVVGVSPLLLIASVVLGVVAASLMKGRQRRRITENQNRPLWFSTPAT